MVPTYSLLVYRNTTDFCISCILPPDYIHSLGGFILILWDFQHKQLFANRDSYISSFQNCIPCISFPYVTAPARTSSTVLNKSGKRQYSCFVPNLRGKTFSLSPLNIKLAVGFYICSLSIWGSFWVLFCFLIKSGFEFCQVLFLHQLIWLHDFSSLAFYYNRLH